MMLNSLFKKSNPYKAFWDWFVKHSDEYYYFEKNHEILFNDLGNQLRKINEDLTFEFSAEIKNGKREFIISADGIRSAFPDVIKLVESAPTLDKWKIIAFRPRKANTVLEFNNGITLGVHDIFFSYEITDDQKIGVTLYVKGLNEDKNEMTGAIFVLLDCVLGEYDVETKLGYIEFKTLNENEKENLKPLSELPKIVDTHFMVQ
jgi:hypothetical protein